MKLINKKILLYYNNFNHFPVIRRSSMVERAACQIIPDDSSSHRGVSKRLGCIAIQRSTLVKIQRHNQTRCDAIHREINVLFNLESPAIRLQLFTIFINILIRPYILPNQTLLFIYINRYECIFVVDNSINLYLTYLIDSSYMYFEFQ